MIIASFLFISLGFRYIDLSDPLNSTISDMTAEPQPGSSPMRMCIVFLAWTVTSFLCHEMAKRVLSGASHTSHSAVVDPFLAALFVTAAQVNIYIAYNSGVSKVFRGARNSSGNRVFCVRVRRKRIISKLFATLSFPYPHTKPIMFDFADNFRDWLIRW